MKYFFILLFSFAIIPSNLSAQVMGCTDPLANNFNASATHNDGSCTYAPSNIDVVNSWNLPPVLDESSGLISFNGYLWTHNDDTDTNIYRLDINNINDYEAFPLPGVVNIDWEEISQDDNYIYVGDFGNNANGNRTDLRILRIEKNSFLSHQPLIDTIWFSYADQVSFEPAGANNTDFDCEAFIVSSDSIYLFTKQWVNQQSSVYVMPKTPGNHIARFRTTIPVEGMVTGATWLEQKRLIVLCGYNPFLQPFIYLLYDFQDDHFQSGNKRKISLNLPFHQVEAITTEDGLQYYVSNERFSFSSITTEQKLHLIDLSDFLKTYIDNIAGLYKPDAAGTFKVYPNPFSDDITIEAKSNDHSFLFEIYNSFGQTVSKGKLNEKATFQTEGLASGIYFMKLGNPHFFESLKIIKE